MKMVILFMKKIIAVMLIILFFAIPITTYADDYEDEEIIKEEVLDILTIVQQLE